MKSWEAYPPKTEKVAIVGLAETTRAKAPFKDTEYEIWGLNEAYVYPFMTRHTRWFQMHPRWDFSRTNNLNHPNHIAWLAQKEAPCMFCNGTGQVTTKEKEVLKCVYCEDGIYKPTRRVGPIYMQTTHNDIARSVAFPLREAQEFVSMEHPYFVSTPAFMLVLAMMYGFKRIELYGFEMGSDTEYHYQRANFEYLIGFGRAKGFDIWLPKASSITRGSLYGYKNNNIGLRQNLEMRKFKLKEQVEIAKTNVNTGVGRIKMVEDIIQEYPEMDEPLGEKYAELRDRFDRNIGELNMVQGAQSEVELIIKMFDGYYETGEEGGDLEI